MGQTLHDRKRVADIKEALANNKVEGHEGLSGGILDKSVVVGGNGTEPRNHHSQLWRVQGHQRRKLSLISFFFEPGSRSPVLVSTRCLA